MQISLKVSFVAHVDSPSCVVNATVLLTWFLVIQVFVKIAKKQQRIDVLPSH